MKKNIIVIWKAFFSLLLLFVIIVQFSPLFKEKSGIVSTVLLLIILMAIFLHTIINANMKSTSPGIEENIQKTYNNNFLALKIIVIIGLFIYNIYKLIEYL